MRRVCRLAVDHPLFDLAVVISIIASCVVAAMAVDPFIAEDRKATLAAVDRAFTVVFAVEACLLIVGYSFGEYWRQPLNRLDFVLVVLALAEVVIDEMLKSLRRREGVETAEWATAALEVLAALKAFRAARVVRIAHDLKLRSVQRLASQFPRVIRAVGGILGVLVLVVLCTGLVMMALFGGAFAGDDGVPQVRQHYDDIGWALVSVVQIMLTADGFDDAHASLDRFVWESGAEKTVAQVAVFGLFAAILLVGNIILLTLFTAVLLSGFGGDDAQVPGAHDESLQDRLRTYLPPPPKIATHQLAPSTEAPSAADKAQDSQDADFAWMLQNSSSFGMNHWDVLEAAGDFLGADEDGSGTLSLEEVMALLREMGYDLGRREASEEVATFMREVDTDGDRQLNAREFARLLAKVKAVEHARSGSRKATERLRATALRRRTPRFVRQHRRPPVPGHFNPLRRWLHRVMYHPFYELGSTFIAAVSTLALAAEYTEAGAAYRAELFALTIVLTMIFAADVLVVFVVKGPMDVLRSPSNCLDIVVVAISAASLVAANVPAVAALRALRVLRVFQLLSEFKQMRTLLDCLSTSIQGTFTVSFFLVLTMFLFGILGVAVFGGTFDRCVDADGNLVRAGGCGAPGEGHVHLTSLPATATRRYMPRPWSAAKGGWRASGRAGSLAVTG